jgi:hypothetical protein
MARRSSAVVPPHTPWATRWSSAQARHGICTGQVRHSRLASRIWRNAGPAVLIGKNNSGSALRQAASLRQFAGAVIALGPCCRHRMMRRARIERVGFAGPPTSARGSLAPRDDLARGLARDRMPLATGAPALVRQESWPVPACSVGSGIGHGRPAARNRLGSVEDPLQTSRHLSSSSGPPPDTATWLARDTALIVDGVRHAHDKIPSAVPGRALLLTAIPAAR